MSIASIVGRGYIKGIHFIPSRGYLSTNTPTPTPRDTHDAWIPDEIVRKFYEDERLKHSKVIKAYKKVAKAEEAPLEIQEIISEYSSTPATLTKSILKEIAADKVALGRLLIAIDNVEKRLLQYEMNAEEDRLLIMIAATIN